MNIEFINQKTYSTQKAIEVYSKYYIRPYEEYAFKKYVKPGMKILDLGCGTGRTTTYLKSIGADVIGIDYVKELIDKGMELYPDLDLRVMNAAELNFSDRSFDLVLFSNQGIDCTERRGEVFFEAFRVLKKGGLFIYTHHNSVTIPRTKRTIRDFLYNIKNIRLGYHTRTEKHENGELKYVFNNIWNEQKMLKEIGFKVVDILANNKNETKLPYFLVGIIERWPMLISQK